MKAILREDGLLFVTDIAASKPYLIKAKANNWYWSSWRWLPLIRQELKGWDEFALQGAEHYERLAKQEATLEGAIRWTDLDRMVFPVVFDQVFKMPLWPGQQRAAMLMVAAKQFYLADDVGLGKTLSSIAALVLLWSKGLFKNALIVTTASVKYQWRLEILKALKPEYHEQFKVTVVDGSPANRSRQYQDDSPIKVVGYEAYRSDLRDGLCTRPQVVILDEAWKIKNPTSMLQRAFKAAHKEVEYKFVLNASPVGNGYEEIFGIFDWLDPTVFLSYRLFKDRFCSYTTIFPKSGKRPFPLFLGYKRVDEMRRRIAGRLMRRTVKDMGWRSPMITVTPYVVELGPSQRLEYQRLKENTMSNALGKTTAARGICLGLPDVAKSPKYLQLLDLLQDQLKHEKVVVFSESKQFITAAAELLKSKKILCATIVGDDTAEERVLTQTNFTEGKISVLLMTSAGEAGLNLQAADVIVNLDIPWNPERLRQRVGRLRPHLGGENRHIRVINILAKATIEERVISVVQEKIGDFKRIFNEDNVDWTGTFDTDFLATLL